MSPIRIALVGDLDWSVTAHRAIPEALTLASSVIGRRVVGEWIGTESLAKGVTPEVTAAQGIWVVPNSPYRSEAGALNAIQFARENGRPFLGTCAGFQHAVLEYARHIAGLPRAGHAETDPAAADPVVSLLSCGLVEQAGDIVLEPGSRLERAYGAERVRETYHCNYGLNPRYEYLLRSGPLQVVARDPAGEVRAVELTGTSFFVATLFQPERAALAGMAHPLINAFIAAAAQ